MTKKFEKEAMIEGNEKFEKAVSRMEKLYDPIYGDGPMRSEFDRDYTRIINCNAYRRLKHKTQVFFSPKNDHICTRIEHVTHVSLVAETIHIVSSQLRVMRKQAPRYIEKTGV